MALTKERCSGTKYILFISITFLIILIFVVIVSSSSSQLTNKFLRFSLSSILPKCRASEAQWHISKKKLNKHCQRHIALKAFNTLTDSINTCRSEKKLEQALNSWSNFILILFGKRREIHVTILTNPTIQFNTIRNLGQTLAWFCLAKGKKYM